MIFILSSRLTSSVDSVIQIVVDSCCIVNTTVIQLYTYKIQFRLNKYTLMVFKFAVHI